MATWYLILFVLGVLLPYSQFAPWIMAHGLDGRGFLAELLVNRISRFFGADVLVSAIVVLTLIREERRRDRIAHAWLPVAATLLVGVSAGLPLVLYMRRETADAAAEHRVDH